MLQFEFGQVWGIKDLFELIFVHRCINKYLLLSNLNRCLFIIALMIGAGLIQSLITPSSAKL